MKGAEAEAAEDEGEVRLDGAVGDDPCEAKEVDGPEVVVCKSFPEEATGNALPVVHIAF